MKYRFIFTTSIITPDREQVYYDAITGALSKLKHLPFEFYIVENNGERKTLLDTIEGVKLLYTNTNARELKKGTKEFHDIRLLSELYEFEDEDLIIKLTGRYTLANPPTFLDSLVGLEKDYDSMMKWMNIYINIYMNVDCILGLFALRYKYLKEFNYMQMESHPSMEHVFARFVRENVAIDRILETKYLGMYFQGNPDILI
jgi:hypothetical protein